MMWSLENQTDLCAYCGFQLDNRPKTCPSCKKDLELEVLKYKRPSSTFYIFLILLFGLVQLFFIQSLINILTDQEIPITLAHAFTGLALAVLLVFVYLRRSWAYAVSILMLSVAGAIVLLTNAGPQLLVQLSGTPLDGLMLGFNQLAISAIEILQISAIGIALFICIFFIGADFVTTSVYMTAAINPRFIGQNGSGLHFAARDYAARGLWGTAILHWQKAITIEPYRVQYQIALIKAYLRLGQREKALVLYERMTKDHPNAAKFDELLTLKAALSP